MKALLLLAGVGLGVLGAVLLRSEPGVGSVPDSAQEDGRARRSAAPLDDAAGREARLRAEIAALKKALGDRVRQDNVIEPDEGTAENGEAAVREFRTKSIPAIRTALKSTEVALKGARSAEDDDRAQFISSFRDRLAALLGRVERATSKEDVESIKSGPDGTVLWNLKNKKRPAK